MSMTSEVQEKVERLAMDCFLVRFAGLTTTWQDAPEHVRHGCRKSAAGILIDRKFRSGAPFAEVQQFHSDMRQLLGLEDAEDA